MPAGTVGEVWLKLASQFAYFNDEARTAEALSADGTMGTVGDVGYLDADNFLYLTDRSTFMIISGGVNIYPQECEDLLITHPKVADAAVFGVPNADLGEEVNAAIQLMPGIDAGSDTEAELIAFCCQPCDLTCACLASSESGRGVATSSESRTTDNETLRKQNGRAELPPKVVKTSLTPPDGNGNSTPPGRALSVPSDRGWAGFCPRFPPAG